MFLTAAGTPVNYTAPGVVETFGYRDSTLTGVSPEWSDAYDIWPDSFDQARIIDEKLDVTGSTQNLYDANTELVVGHTLISREMGQSDNAEVLIRWDTPTELSTVGQVSPAAFIDLNASDPLQMGVLPVFDVSIFGGVTYAQNAFRQSPLSEVFDPSYYTNIGGGAGFPWPGTISYGAGVSHWWRLRCVGGYMSAWFDDRKIFDTIAVPAWATGRDGWGIHVIPIHVAVGETFPSLNVNTPVTDITRTTIGQWMWRPYNGPI